MNYTLKSTWTDVSRHKSDATKTPTYFKEEELLMWHQRWQGHNFKVPKKMAVPLSVMVDHRLCSYAKLLATFFCTYSTVKIPKVALGAYVGLQSSYLVDQGIRQLKKAGYLRVYRAPSPVWKSTRVYIWIGPNSPYRINNREMNAEVSANIAKKFLKQEKADES